MSVWITCSEMGALIYSKWEAKLLQPSWKTIWQGISRAPRMFVPVTIATGKITQKLDLKHYLINFTDSVSQEFKQRKMACLSDDVWGLCWSHVKARSDSAAGDWGRLKVCSFPSLVPRLAWSKDQDCPLQCFSWHLCGWASSQHGGLEVVRLFIRKLRCERSSHSCSEITQRKFCLLCWLKLSQTVPDSRSGEINSIPFPGPQDILCCLSSPFQGLPTIISGVSSFLPFLSSHARCTFTSELMVLVITSICV